MINLSIEDKKWVDSMFERLDKKLSKTATEVRDFVPYLIKDGKYIPEQNVGIAWWTNGFYGGLMWLMYNATKNEEYRKTAERQEELLDGAFVDYDKLNHDVGFMWGLTSKANYMLTGNKASRLRSLYAANVLMARTNIKSGFIRAWDYDPKVNTNPNYSIIDCMMNIPLLYWASREKEDERFSYIAHMHAEMTMRYHVRENGSVVHIAVHAEDHDELIETLAGQGSAVGSSWTRGQAWAVYGFILSYIHTGEKKYLDICKKISDYFIKRAEEYNYKIPADFDQPDDVDYIDNSATACACCGLMELYKATEDRKYLECAIKLLKNLESDCIFDDSNQSILQNAMAAYYDGEQLHLIYGDFFLAEAILKLKGSDFLIW